MNQPHENNQKVPQERLNAMCGYDLFETTFRITGPEVAGLVQEVAEYRQSQSRTPDTGMHAVVELKPTAWPAEVKAVLPRLAGAENLPEKHLNNLCYHINRMWLQRMPIDLMLEAGARLVHAMEQLK